MTSQSESLIVLKELFPESRGDLDLAIARISDGHATQFGEVKKKDKAPKRVEYGNGRGRGRGASTGAPRGRSEFRGRGRGRGASASTGGVPRNATETSSTWPTTTTTNTTGEALPEWASDDVTAPSTSNATTTTESKPEANDNNDTTSSAPKGEQLAAPLATSGNGDYTGAKPKSRIIDKNSKSSWASIAKPPAPVKAAPAVQTAALQTKLPETTAPQAKLDAPHAPLTEQNLEAATEDQVDLPQPPTATVASLAGEPATGPSSLAGGSVAASTGGPPGLKSGQQSSAARIGTPVGGRRLNQNEAVVMPGSEREPTSRLGVQFGSLGLGDDEVYNDKSETASNVPVQHKQADEVRHESYPPQSQRQDKLAESYGGYGGYGLSSVQQQQGGFGAQSHDQYSNFYGQEQPRASPFAGQSDYYQHQQQAHAHQISQQSYGGSQSAASQRTDTTSRPTEQSSRYGESSSSPMTSMGSQNPPAGTSPAPHHPGAPQQHSQYPMHPQYGAPNPYAYYGYGYGYPQQQQQHSAYAPMYGQQQRGGYGGQNQYQGAPVSHTPVGTSQDRFERSTAEYQRQQQQQQQMSQYSQGGFGNTDFLGSSRNAPPSNEAMDPFKGYNSQGSTGSRDDTKGAPTGFGGVQSTSSPFGGQQMQGAGHYGGGGPAAGQSAGQYGGNEQQGGQQQGGQQQGGQQGQYSQYGNYGRGGAHQQYAGGNGQWGQQGY